MLLIIVTVTVNLVIALCSSITELVNTTQTEIITDHVYGIVHTKAIEVDLEYMEHGRIVESGTHEELMQIGGSCAHLFETQAKNY